MRALLTILILSLLFNLSLTQHSISYLSVPLLHRYNSTHSSFNIPLTINQYPYQLQLSLHCLSDSFAPLTSVSALRQPSSNQNYKKHNNSVYGVLEYYGSRRVDTRVDYFRQLWLNGRMYVWDLVERQQYIDLRNVEQHEQAQLGGMADGRVTLSNYRQSRFLGSLRKYSQYHQAPVVAFDAEDGDKGWVYFGAFPADRLVNPQKVGKTRIDNDHQQGWKVSVTGISLTPDTNTNTNTGSTAILNQAVFTLSTSEKLLTLPARSVQTLSKTLSGCSLKPHYNTTLITCTEQAYQQYHNYKLSFTLKQSPIPLQYSLTNLLLGVQQGQYVLAIAIGKVDDYYLSSAMLKEYMVGIDYSHSPQNNQGVLMYGKKKDKSLVDRVLLLKVFIFGAVVVFIVSLAVVYYASQLKPNELIPLPTSKTINKSEFYTSKEEGYEMADLEEGGNQSP